MTNATLTELAATLSASMEKNMKMLREHTGVQGDAIERYNTACECWNNIMEILSERAAASHIV